jgi:hypothetical protein
MNIGLGTAEVESPATSLIGRVIRAGAMLLGTAGLGRAQTVPPAQPDSTGTIVGIVTMREGGLPLAYSVVSATAVAREQFSDDQGVFRLTALRPGPLQLRVRHLGYTPAEIPTVVHSGRVDTVRVALSHIAVRLTAVQVRGYPECRNPGVPAATTDSAFATVFDQLRQNADQYRLLTRTYPYVYSVERTFSTTLVDGDVRMDGIDTTTFASLTTWTYRPGTVVERDGPSRVFRTGTLMMNIPTLANFADPAFIDNHCFYNGGLETVDGVDLLRVDFVAAARISDPDVNGSMYLDPGTFEIRRSIVRLSKIPRGVAGLVETEAVTYFGELLSSVPVIAGIMSVNQFAANSRRPDAATAAHEQQRLVAVQFLKGRPGEDPKKP